MLKSLNIKKRVVGIIPITENLIDADAQKPSDIVTSYSGQTIEIRNTDAEGRLILADALTYGIEKYKPAYTIDLATLTGACLIALGNNYAAIMGNNKKLIEELIEAGNNTEPRPQAISRTFVPVRNSANSTSFSPKYEKMDGPTWS